jgi:hypothetical protein
MATYPLQPVRSRQSTCTDHVVGAILSGWRYDISGISPDLRGDYEMHLAECAHCRNKQRLHRSVDLLLFVVTTLSFAAFLLATLVLHRLRALNHYTSLHLHLPPEAALMHGHIPTSITVSLQAVTALGVLVSLVLWVLVAIATPLPDMVSDMLKERGLHDTRDPLGKQAA